MPDPLASPVIPPSVQKKIKSLNHPQLAQLAILTRWLHSRTFRGRVLRVLVHRLKHPEATYSNEELAILLMISVAEELV